MSPSTDIQLGTVGKFREFPRSEVQLVQPMQMQEDLEASSLLTSSNIRSKLWKFVWPLVVTGILILLGYGLIHFGSTNSPNNANTIIVPMPVWSTDNSTFVPETTSLMHEIISLETTTMAPTVLKLELTTPSNPSETVTLSELAKSKKWCPWGMNNERCNRFHYQFTSTTIEPVSHATFNAEFCAGQLGNQTYLEVNWLCKYCHKRASVWNKTEWESDSFPSSCSANCFDNKHRRACAKRAFEWNQKTGEFGSPFNCKHC